MVAAAERIEIGAHCMFANHCFVTDADHRFDDPELPITWQGFNVRGPVRIGDNCWFGTNCVVTGGVTIGDRTVVGANSVVTRDLPPGSGGRGRAREGHKGDRVQKRGSAGTRRGPDRCVAIAVLAANPASPARGPAPRRS